jgi:DNA-binding IclR family transcriptional regulator
VPSAVPAAQETLDVLRYLARHPGPVAAAAMARDLGLPRSTTYHLLAVLLREGFVVHLPEERRYGLGVTAFELGSAYTRQAPLQRLARPLLARLVDTTGHTAHVAVLHGRDVLYVIEERAPGRAPLVTDVGVRLPAQLTASGRALLAGLPASQVRALYPDRDAFVERHGLGPTALPVLPVLRRILVDVRRRGYAVEDGEVTPGFTSVAAAAYDHTTHPVAGIAVTYPSDEAPPERLADQVRATAAALTTRIGGRPPA